MRRTSHVASLALLPGWAPASEELIKRKEDLILQKWRTRFGRAARRRGRVTAAWRQRLQNCFRKRKETVGSPPGQSCERNKY